MLTEQMEFASFLVCAFKKTHTILSMLCFQEAKQKGSNSNWVWNPSLDLSAARCRSLVDIFPLDDPNVAICCTILLAPFHHEEPVGRHLSTKLDSNNRFGPGNGLRLQDVQGERHTQIWQLEPSKGMSKAWQHRSAKGWTSFRERLEVIIRTYSIQ